MLGASALSAQQRCPAVEKGEMPLKYTGGATIAAITPCDLMTRLYIYADDSMRGRAAGTPDNVRATAWIASEAKRMGLQPAGDSGGYFQWIPVFARSFDSASAIVVAGTTFRGGVDFTAAMPDQSKVLPNLAVVFGGVANDTIDLLSPEQVRGKVLVVEAAAGGGGGRGGFGGGRGGGAAAQLFDPAQPAAGRGGITVNTSSAAMASAIFGKPVDQLTKGAEGQPMSLTLAFKMDPRPTRNVVAIWPGSDPALKNEYVAIGGHSDHNPPSAPADHDSVKAFNQIARVEGQNAVRVPGAVAGGGRGRGGQPASAGQQAYQAMVAAAAVVVTVPNPNTPAATGGGNGRGGNFGGGGRGGATLSEEQRARIQALTDSLHRAHGGARIDSINNGADDDGSGSVSTLEVAEAFAKGTIKPKRSIIFVWHTGEERGLWGSQYFTNHPTVPRDSIVAQLNMDMVGRGAASDSTGQDKDGVFLHGANDYLQLVGSRRLSTELGDIVEAVNQTEKLPFRFDYAMDTNGHPDRIYCRSDHYNYARYGIPITFFTTGLHADYHMITDEPQYIQYEHMARVDQLVFDVAVKVANLDHRVVVDKPKPDNPFGGCVQ